MAKNYVSVFVLAAAALILSFLGSTDAALCLNSGKNADATFDTAKFLLVGPKGQLEDGKNLCVETTQFYSKDGELEFSVSESVTEEGEEEQWKVPAGSSQNALLASQNDENKKDNSAVNTNLEISGNHPVVREFLAAKWSEIVAKKEELFGFVLTASPSPSPSLSPSSSATYIVLRVTENGNVEFYVHEKKADSLNTKNAETLESLPSSSPSSSVILSSLSLPSVPEIFRGSSTITSFLPTSTLSLSLSSPSTTTNNSPSWSSSSSPSTPSPLSDGDDYSSAAGSSSPSLPFSLSLRATAPCATLVCVKIPKPPALCKKGNKIYPSCLTICTCVKKKK